MKISDEIRRAIENCGLTRYRIAKETGIAESTLSRFMHGYAMTTDVLDRLAELLDMHITARSKKHESKITHKRSARGKSNPKKGR